jgi:citronellol/citronellal dehydrogenase
VDVRNETQIQDAVDMAVKTFGGIDVVVNNASAIYLTGTAETSVKNFDLMHDIIVRGTFLVYVLLSSLARANNADDFFSKQGIQM